MTSHLSNVVLLAGGVGGARMAQGLANCLAPGALTVIANVGDDQSFHGLHVSPDIDTLIYTLSGRIDRRQGWGVEGDTTRALDVLRDLGAPVWMRLGDADLGLHIWRTQRLASGASLTDVTLEAALKLGSSARILPATDDPLGTKLLTDAGWMDFQPWFVGARCEPAVRAVKYEGVDAASASPAALAAIDAAEVIVIAPSNPILSIEPIVALPDLRGALQRATAPRIAISPLIDGKAVKGPLARLLADLGLPGGAAGVAERYASLIDGFVADEGDTGDIETIRGSGLPTLAVDILMKTPERAGDLAAQVLDFAASLHRQADRPPS